MNYSPNGSNGPNGQGGRGGGGYHGQGHSSKLQIGRTESSTRIWKIKGAMAQGDQTRPSASSLPSLHQVGRSVTIQSGRPTGSSCRDWLIPENQTRGARYLFKYKSIFIKCWAIIARVEPFT
ncbi:hypothetical protein SAY86_011826 [Trapa natans]|uniref:Uncharacterized protein n=1 Tax=Trapa natans TaxID=22666 RepID=A0AAN7R8N8_TRANT|nr:hypothetical protein SAY86_011826 [Trapa natans]